jgi:hypothetical protein
MMADPQIGTAWEFGLFMLAPVAVALILGNLLRWRDRRLERGILEDVKRRETSSVTRTDPRGFPVQSVVAPIHNELPLTQD